MPTDNNSTAGYALAGATIPQTKQKMRVNVQEVDNGFIVSCGYKIGYGENTNVASTMDDVISIISDYLKQE